MSFESNLVSLLVRTFQEWKGAGFANQIGIIALAYLLRKRNNREALLRLARTYACWLLSQYREGFLAFQVNHPRISRNIKVGVSWVETYCNYTLSVLFGGMLVLSLLSLPLALIHPSPMTLTARILTAFVFLIGCSWFLFAAEKVRLRY